MRVACALFVAILFSAGAGRAEPRLLEAERLARQKEIAAARDLYRAVLADGKDGAGLRYNLGTLALEEGDVAEAILQLKAALRRDPRHDDARHNLELALEMRTDRLADAQASDPLLALGRSLPPAFARMALAVPLAVCGALFLLSAFFRRGRRILRAALLAALLVAAGGGALYGARLSFERTKEVVVMAKESQAYKEPDAEGRPAFLAHAGLSGLFIEEKNGFARVRLDNGLETWIAEGDLDAVP